jgi:hypothetical protein
MKLRIALILAVSVLSVTFAQAAKHDAKTAGHATKHTAKASGHKMKHNTGKAARATEKKTQ